MFELQRCDDLQKEVIFRFFPKHQPQKQFQFFATNQSLFAVQHGMHHNDEI